MHQIAPVPNRNGSPANALAEQMMEVCHALEAAVTLMARWQPHGRDYQIGGDYQADRTEFLRRLGLVEAMAQQYEREAIAVQDHRMRVWVMDELQRGAVVTQYNPKARA